jgi:hypothetical protein
MLNYFQHCSLAVSSLCTIKATLAYFAGELPKNGEILPTVYVRHVHIAD